MRAGTERRAILLGQDRHNEQDAIGPELASVAQGRFGSRFGRVAEFYTIDEHQARVLTVANHST